MYRTVFVVSGRNPFPTDMLRYDRCVPSTEQDSAKINKAITDPYGENSITVALVKFHKLKGDAFITRGRWESFGWKVSDATVTTKVA